MMQKRHFDDKIRSKGPHTTRNLVTLTDPVERVKAYRQKDMEEEAERQRRIRWNLIKDEGPSAALGSVAANSKFNNAKRQDSMATFANEYKHLNTSPARLDPIMAKSALSACDSTMDLVDPRKDLASQLSHHSL